MRLEIIPAIGCTEPIAVSLCTAKAAGILDEKPDKIDVFLSANVIKNAMGTGIPGATGQNKLGVEDRQWRFNSILTHKQYSFGNLL